MLFLGQEEEEKRRERPGHETSKVSSSTCNLLFTSFSFPILNCLWYFCTCEGRGQFRYLSSPFVIVLFVHLLHNFVRGILSVDHFHEVTLISFSNLSLSLKSYELDHLSSGGISLMHKQASFCYFCCLHFMLHEVFMGRI